MNLHRGHKTNKTGLLKFLKAAAAISAVFFLLNHGYAQEDEAKWKISTELSYVATGGNTSTSSFSLGNTFARKWDKNTLTFRSYVLRSHATTKIRTARGSETDFEVTEQKVARLAAENYVFSGQYDRRLAQKLLGQLSMSWDRNIFSGVAGRLIMTAGTGYPWLETKKTVLKTDAAVTLTTRRYLGDSFRTFAGFRAILALDQKFSEKSTASSRFIFDENLKKSADWRFDWTNSLSAPVSRTIFLKTSVRMLYSNLPAMEYLDLFDILGQPTGIKVPYPLKKLDTFFTTSVVINF